MGGSKLRPAGAVGADAFDQVLGLLRLEAFRENDLGDAHVGKTEGPMADAARKVHVSSTHTGVVVMADAILVRAGAVVDVVKQMRLAQQGESTDRKSVV